MMVISAPPMNLLLAMLGFFMAAWAAWRGAQLLVRGLRQADHPAGTLWVVRGIRGVIIAISLGALSGGVLLANKGLLTFGVIFLGEELYETGVVLLALRSRLKASEAS
jgi:uncharacterized membrane protein YadS